MFARLMMWTVASRYASCIMLGQAFVVRGSVGFICLTTASMLEKPLFAPERHRHQARHVESRARRSDRSNQPYKPTVRNRGRACCLPKYFVFRPESAQRKYSADRKPTCKEC